MFLSLNGVGFILLFYCIAICVLLLVNYIYYINIFQVSAYSEKKLIEWFFEKNNKQSKLFVLLNFTFMIICFLFEILKLIFNFSNCYYFVLLFILIIICVINLTTNSNNKIKLKLVFTKRIKRLLFTVFVLNLLITITLSFYLFGNGCKFLSLIYVLLPLYPFNLILFNYVNLPIEKLINLSYINKAKTKLKQFPNLQVIGITGSFGKTSTKFILTHILKEKYFTLCTPNSFNTPLGITKTILGQLKQHHEIFVVEMGADKKNDINKICKLVKPNIAILTSIENQHLKTFKTFDNIVKTKYQIIENLQDPKFAVFNSSNHNVDKLYVKTKTADIVAVNVSLNSKLALCYASNIKVTKDGSEFFVNCKDRRFKLKTSLLGEHNIINILLAVSVAVFLNVETYLIKKAVQTLAPIKSRLELIKTLSGGLILNDSFNSNIEGSKQALQVLEKFENYHKIVITPGLVELGKDEFKKNYEFGKQISKVANEVLIVNYVNKEALTKGLQDGKFPEQNIRFYQNFNEAFDSVKHKLVNNHIILIENDLPDVYI